MEKSAFADDLFWKGILSCAGARVEGVPDLQKIYEAGTKGLSPTITALGVACWRARRITNKQPYQKLVGVPAHMLRKHQQGRVDDFNLFGGFRIPFRLVERLAVNKGFPVHA
jgi:hypothetical protein